jgi:hypothetical protein
MATTAASGAGFGRGGWWRGRRATVVVVVLAFAAIVVPFALRDIGRGGAQESPASRATAPADPTRSDESTRSHHDAASVSDPALGARGDLPALLPARTVVGTSAGTGTIVRLGDVTDGVLRRTPDGQWRVLVRWDDRFQPVPTRGPVALDGGPGAHAPASWVSDEGLLYTRVALTLPGHFRVYRWEPAGGSAYTPPALVATDLGTVCFNRAFTAFGNCHVTG